MIHISKVHKQGSAPTNEDAYVENLGRKLFAVIDGATGVGGLPGKIAAETMQHRLDNRNTDASFIDLIHQGNRDLAERTKQELGQEINAISKEKRSTCGIAAIQIHETYMEYAQSGDCMIFVKYQDGGIQALSYDHVMRLDEKVISDLYEAISGRIGADVGGEAFQKVYQEEKGQIIPALAANRRKLNTVQGYSIMDGTAEAMDFLSYGRIPLQQVEKVLLLTDGMQLYGVDGDVWRDTAMYAMEYGIERLLKYVVQQEESDIYLQRYPRFKYADDKTAILLECSDEERGFIEKSK